MKKKFLLLGLSISLSAGVMGFAIFSGHVKNSNFKKNVADEPSYTLELDATEHLVASDSYKNASNQSVTGFSITNDSGTKFFFHRNSNPVPTLNTNNSIVYVSHNTDSIVMLRSDLDAVNYSQPINGIKSITVDFDITNSDGTTDISDQVFLNVNYGFIHDGASYFASGHRLESGVTYNFDNALPSVFNLMTDMNGYVDEEHNNYYRAYLKAVTIVYSCSESDTAKEAFLDNYFSGEPVVIETTDGNAPSKIQCGAYPQSLLEDTIRKTYLDAKYSTASTLNEYYILKGNGYNESDVRAPSIDSLKPSGVKLYARVQATSTGYNNEYVNGNYYWFVVEPVEWRVLIKENENEYLVASTKVLQNGVKYKGNSTLNVDYNHSDLKNAVDALATKIIRTTDKIKLNSDFNAKVYALSASQYRAKPAGIEPTPFVRTGIAINPGLSTGLHVGYWTNRVGYSNPSQHRAEIITENGTVDYPYQTNMYSVRPGMVITIE